MLTNEQIATIKANIISGLELPSKHITFDARHIEILLTKYEQLTQHNRYMTEILGLFANPQNWKLCYVPSQDMSMACWILDNPATLAEQALEAAGITDND